MIFYYFKFKLVDFSLYDLMMNNKGLVMLLYGVIFSISKLSAQENQFSGWLSVFHTQRFSQHWGVSFDGQLRSAHRADYLRNILIRPSVNYYFDKNKIAALGYAFIANNGRNVNGEPTYRSENRVWQQVIVNQKISRRLTLQHRLRLEQRFFGDNDSRDDDYFAQRLRYFARAIIPLKKDTVFKRGAFLGLQNELFTNVQNKGKMNNHFFDQNRSYASIGYRFSMKLDTEIGYLNQYVKNREGYNVNHNFQLAIYTRF